MISQGAGGRGLVSVSAFLIMIVCSFFVQLFCLFCSVLKPTCQEDVHLRHAASCDYMVGPDLLICPIYTPGISMRQVYLPTAGEECPTQWFDLQRHVWLAGGTTTTAECSLTATTPITFVRSGAVVAMLKSPPTRSTDEISIGDCGRVFTLFMGPGQTSTQATHVEDDGISINGIQFVFTFQVTATTERVECQLDVHRQQIQYLPVATDTISDYNLPFNSIEIQLCPGDSRALHVFYRDTRHCFETASGQISL
eukprot:m.156524 g.156524  ORF g.156524 m.156524 type:complete len:253 (-) comp16297_c0_seq9:60-818(-)